MIRVRVTIGIGQWKITRDAMLVACPHIGDLIEVGDTTIMCERVCICQDKVYVNQTVHFQSPDEMKEYKDWKVI